MSYTTNAALRHHGLTPKLIGTVNNKIIRCFVCEEATAPEEIRIVPDVGVDDVGDLPIYFNRIEVLVRCYSCKTAHWVVAMPRDQRVAMDFFVDTTP
jgi:hypothetical protein